MCVYVSVFDVCVVYVHAHMWMHVLLYTCRGQKKMMAILLYHSLLYCLETRCLIEHTMGLEVRKPQ